MRSEHFRIEEKYPPEDGWSPSTIQEMTCEETFPRDSLKRGRSQSGESDSSVDNLSVHLQQEPSISRLRYTTLSFLVELLADSSSRPFEDEYDYYAYTTDLFYVERALCSSDKFMSLFA